VVLNYMSEKGGGKGKGGRAPGSQAIQKTSFGRIVGGKLGFLSKTDSAKGGVGYRAPWLEGAKFPGQKLLKRAKGKVPPQDVEKIKIPHYVKPATKLKGQRGRPKKHPVAVLCLGESFLTKTLRQWQPSWYPPPGVALSRSIPRANRGPEKHHFTQEKNTMKKKTAKKGLIRQTQW